MNRRYLHIALFALLLLTSLVGCRRDLWIYTDEFRQIELRTDWSQATERPDGMTWWFMNDDMSGQNRHETTADVYRTMLNLPRGLYSGVVFDYSPQEYSHNEFLGLTRIDSALVHIRAAADQPLPDLHLYGDSAVPSYLHGVPMNFDGNGMYLVAAEPEEMNADTLHHVNIVTGTDGDLILWDDRESYQATLTRDTLYAFPRPIVWKLRVTVYVRGINHMFSVRGSVAGLADGCWLGALRHTSTPCLQQLDTWQAYNAMDSIGYIATSINAFGLPDLEMPPSPSDARGDMASRGVDGVEHDDSYDHRLRLNLQFLLRDRATVLNYHFDVADDCITIFEDQLVVRIDIPIDYGHLPDLPYVDAADDTGFDATVTPWDDGGTAEMTM